MVSLMLEVKEGKKRAEGAGEQGSKGAEGQRGRGAMNNEQLIIVSLCPLPFSLLLLYKQSLPNVGVYYLC